MENSLDIKDKKKELLDYIRRSRMPEKEKRRWTRFIRGARGHSEGLDEYLTKLKENLIRNIQEKHDA